MSEVDGQERRGFFRINDDVALTYRLVSGDAATKTLEDLGVNENGPATLMNELEKMNEVSRIHFRHVEKESPEVARYFSYIEEKINLLAHHIMMANDELFVESTQPVNISGSGVSFTADTELEIGSCLEVKFTLNPSMVRINTFSEVVSCKLENGGFRVAVVFKTLRDADRDMLIRHVVKKQMNNIRENNE